VHVHVHVLHCTCTCITFSHHSPREDAIGDQKVSDPLTLSLTKSSNSSTRTDLHVTHWGAHIQFVCSLHRFALFPRLSQKFWPAPLGGEPGSPGREGGAGLPSGGDGHFGMEPGSTGGARLHPKPPGSTPKFVSAPLMWGARLHPGRICRAPLVEAAGARRTDVSAPPAAAAMSQPPADEPWGARVVQGHRQWSRAPRRARRALHADRQPRLHAARHRTACSPSPRERGGRQVVADIGRVRLPHAHRAWRQPCHGRRAGLR